MPRKGSSGMQIVRLAGVLLLAAGCARPTPPLPIPTALPTAAVPTSTSLPASTPTPEPVSGPEVLKGEHPYTSEATGLEYYLFIPSTYGDDPTARWPLILFLHGAGMRGGSLEDVLYEALPQILTFTPNYPFLVLSPHLAGSEDAWHTEANTARLLTLLDEVTAAYAVDPERVIFTGSSLGAGGVWNIGLRHPDRFAALVPVMGFFDLNDPALPPDLCNLKDTPLWAFHGSEDPIVPLEAESGLVEALNECGGRARLTVYPGEAHDITGEVYNDPDLLAWMLEQNLQNRPPPR